MKETVIKEIAAYGYFRSVRVVCGAQVLPHPALLPDLDGGIDVAVVVGYRINAAIKRGQSGEGALLTVGCAHTVGGVCPNIIGGIGM